MSKEALLQKAAIVRDENTESANTAVRIGELFIDTIETLFSQSDELTTDVNTVKTQLQSALSDAVSSLQQADSNLQKQINGKQDILTIDTALLANSTNPVQNKAIKTALDNSVEQISAELLTLQKNRYAAYGAEYDTANGTWSMHKVGDQYLVTKLTSEDMEKICATPNLNGASVLNGAYRNNARTNRPIDVYRIIRSTTTPIDMRDMARDNKSLEVLYFLVSGNYAYAVASAGLTNSFLNCEKLRVLKYLDISKCTAANSLGGAFKGCKALEECYLKGLNTNLDLSDCTLLTQDSLIYLVEQAGTSAKTLTFTAGLDSGWKATDKYPTFKDFSDYASTKGFNFQTV